jgi:hypothetical protein
MSLVSVGFRRSVKVCSLWIEHNYCMVWYGMVWYGMVWYGMVLYCIVLIVLYGIVWYCMVWYCMVWYGMVWYGIVSSIPVCLVNSISDMSLVSVGFRRSVKVCSLWIEHNYLHRYTVMY